MLDVLLSVPQVDLNKPSRITGAEQMEEQTPSMSENAVTPPKTRMVEQKKPAAPPGPPSSSSKAPRKKTEKRARAVQDTEAETPAKKPSTTAEGFGGSQCKAKACVICHRPRERAQRGRACPTCLVEMRGMGVRSIAVVLEKEALCKDIAEKSLATKPIDQPSDKRKAIISRMEKLLQDLRSMPEDVD